MSDANDKTPERPQPPKESLSFQDLMADLGELPVADPKVHEKKKKSKAEVKVPPLRNRVIAPPEAAPRPGGPKAIYDRPRPNPNELERESGPRPGPTGGAGQPAAIFFDDSRRQAIQDEKSEEEKKNEDLLRINAKVLGGSGYQTKPMWTTALLFAAITGALLYPNLSSDAFGDEYQPYLAFIVVFFAAITGLVSASGILNEETWLGRILCLGALGVGAGACYLVYPIIVG